MEHAGTRRGINFCSNHLAQAFTMSSCWEGYCEKARGLPLCWRRHMLMLLACCYCCCCCLRIPWFSYLPIRSLGMRKTSIMDHNRRVSCFPPLLSLLLNFNSLLPAAAVDDGDDD